VSLLDQLADLGGKTAVVIGGAGGLGGYTSWALSRSGVRVIALDKDQSAIDAWRPQAEGSVETPVDFVCGDARDAGDLERTFARVDGTLDILVNVVGGSFFREFEALSDNAVEALVRLNFDAPVAATRRAIPLMSERGGSVITVTSTEGVRGCPNMSIYAAMKAAMNSLSATLAVELGPRGIRVNAIAPDVIQTPNLERLLGESAYPPDVVERRYEASVPLGRPGDREDYAGVLLFLASKLSRYVTGQVIKLDGGTTAAPGFLNWPGSGWFCFMPLEVSTALAPLASTGPADAAR
jgi:3-oxoacyl-[acyl-carrier protein] reductase